ncbi:MAG: TonB-dependent receptor, partial [Desulfobacterales bacterium]|nr:TonB-dependent receptor [Desulfobacterales bacterium]
YKTLRSLGNFFVQYNPMEGLILRSNLGYDIFSRSDGAFYPQATTLLGSELGGAARRANTLNINWLNENTINYVKKIGDHTINILGGATFQKSHLEGIFAGSTGFITDGFESYNLEAGETDYPPSSVLSEWQVVSFLGRVSYDFKNKYLFSVSGRYDGSSRLGKNDRYDFFPAVSAAWRVSEESFLEDLKSNGTSLKIRASYGVGGNDQIGNYSSLPSFYTISNEFGNQSVTGVSPGGFGNPDIKWERTTQLNLGANIGLFNNSLDITVDYYDKKTTDLLAPRMLATESGFGSITVNAGELENNGVEIEVGGNIDIGEMKWDISANASFEKNKFISLGEYNQADTVRTGNTARI